MGNGLLELIYVRNLLFTKEEDLKNLAEYCLLSPLSLLVTSAADPFKYVPVCVPRGCLSAQKIPRFLFHPWGYLKFTDL